nr:hypothetical protein [Eubacterium sp.]
SVKYKGVSVWPYVRCYLVDMLGYQKARRPSASNVIFILKNLFAYNPFVINKQMDIWSYSGVITRKQVGDKFYHHVSGALPFINDRVLNLENPESSRPHFKKSEIPEKYIVSNAWSILLSRGFEFVLRLKNLSIKDENVFEQINKQYNIDFDYKFRIRLLYAQKLATDFLLKVGKKPKVVAMECPYDQSGYVWSFHEHDIPVVELQHGVLNDNHYAYNSMFQGGILGPDEICVYGDVEYKYLNNRVTPFCAKVSKTGLFILDKANQFFDKDIFEHERKKYHRIVVVAGQSDCEKELLSFIEQASKKTPDIYYAYIPRRACPLECNAENVKIYFNVNIYQYLKWCDIHCTVSSTTCLEAQYFNKPNIFVELNSTAKQYYGNLLREENGSFFANTIDSFISALDKCAETQQYSFLDLFTKGNVEKMREVFNKYIYD